MSDQERKHSDLTKFLLNHVRKRPAMYLGDEKISFLLPFITGYMVSNNGQDEYFGENGFIEWYYNKLSLKNTGLWQTSFLERADNNEKRALNLFFTELEEYQSKNAKAKRPKQ